MIKKLTPHEDKEKKNALKNKDQRHSRSKIPMLCFVPEQMHSKGRAKRTSGKRQKKQRFFRNSPLIMNGSLLVRKHGKKTDQIDQDPINEKIHWQTKLITEAFPYENDFDTVRNAGTSRNDDLAANAIRRIAVGTFSCFGTRSIFVQTDSIWRSCKIADSF